MNLFTYLRRSITSSEEALCGRFLKQFKDFLSVIVGADPNKNSPFGLVKRDFGILSNFGDSKLLSNNMFNQSSIPSWVSVIFLTLLTAFGTLAQSTSLAAFTDLSVKNSINSQNPTIGQDVTYTIKVKNDGTVKATGVELTDILPIGVTLKTVNVGGKGSTSNSTTAGVTTIIWNVGEVGATPTELTMTIVGTVAKRGVWFNTVEITKEIEVDIDSSPNNHNINEDDQDATCFSIEDYFYKGDEFITALPAGYTNVIWTKKVGNGVPSVVTATTPGVILLNDGSGNIKITDITAYTEFAFSATNKNCPIAGCCPIKFIYGPLGSIGDYVFNDNNKDGIQNTGDTPLSGVKVILYKADGVTKLDSAITDVNGKYLFDSLQTDNYKVKFILPTGATFSPTGAGTPSTSSVAGTDGFSPVIPIDVEGTGKAKDNLDVDAGIITKCNINVGTLTATMPNFCLPTSGSVVLTATTTISPIIPTGYSIKYVLTKGADLVIQQIANTPTFSVTSTGEYRIHTLVYDGNSANGSYLDLSTIVLGTTKATDVISNIAQKSICATFDATGVKISVNLNPDAPVFAGTTICAGSKVILGDKDLTNTGISYAWFTSATATTPFATTHSIEVSPVITTTYYVETTSNVSCACASKRGSVTVTVNPKPENPIAKSSLANDCTKNLQTVNLADAITSIPVGSAIEWHVANDVSSAIVTNTTLVGAGTYYAFAKSTAGCYSGGVPVTANINPCTTCQNPATADIPVIASVCGNITTPIQLKVIIGGSASGGIWTSNGTGNFDGMTSLTPTYTPSAADVTKGSVEFTFTTNHINCDPSCVAAVAKTILVFKAKPLAPENLKCSKMICLGDSVKLFSVSQGNIVKWYATATSTTSLGIVNNSEGFMVSPTAEGTYTYYAEATTPDGCVSDRSSISFIVKQCLTDLAVIKKIYTPNGVTNPDYLLGQTATYSIEAQNIGTANATDVKVNDILPAGATYVSSIPVGEYNSTTGVWTIGNLTQGSTKALLIQVILNKIGTVTNTAEISSSNEDPAKKDNNKSTVTVKVVEIADLSLKKTVNKTIVNIGNEVEYTITVLNSGPSTATNVEIKDKLPVGLTYISSPTLTESGGVLTGLAASIAKGATAVFTFKAKVNKDGKITNLAEVTKSDQKDPNSTPGNASTIHEDDDDSVDINSTPLCILEKPTLTCGFTQKTICLGGSVTLTASGCVGSSEYVWSNGGSTSSITVSPQTDQTYVVYCKKDNCKSESSNAVEIKVVTIDSPLLAASPSKICAGESTILTASGCSGVVEWQTSPKQTGPQITVKPTVSETYNAICKEHDCVSSLASVDVIVVPKPTAPSIACKKAEICPSESISLTAMNCSGQIKWSTGQETTTITVSPISTTSYTATCSVNGCTSGNSDSFILTVKPISVPTIKITNLIVCAGGSSTLTAEGCTGDITWYFDSKTLKGATIIVKPTATTTYYATCSSIVCSSDKSAPITVQVANPAPPIVSSGTVSTICAGSTVQLTATGCETGTVTWSDGQKGAVLTVKPLVSSSYTATCSIGTCVSDNSIKRNITVTNFAKPTITATKLEICSGNSVTLTANGCDGTVKWSDGVTGSPRTVTPTADVKYTATCESSTCKSDVSNELAIKVNPAGTTPTITATKTQTCACDEVTLTANNCNGVLLWNNGATTASITVKPSVTTIYSVKCTLNGCGEAKTSEPVTVKVGTPNAPTITSSSPSVCAGGSVVLTANGCTSGTVLWSNSKTGVTITETVNSTTTYTAICKQETCSSPESNKITVLVAFPSVPTISCATSTICAGSTITLYAIGCEGTVKWSDGQTGATVTATPASTTQYTATCSVGTCTSAASSVATVNVGNPPAPQVTCNSTSICQGIQVTLTATNCTGTIIWNDGQVGGVIIAKPNATTTYTAICKLDKCESVKSNPVTVTVGANIKTPITKNLNNVCPFLTVDLASGVTSTLSVGGVFEYHTGMLPTSPLVSNPNAATTGTYYVFEKTGTGCYSSPGIISTYINPDCTPKDCAKTPAIVSAGADATICAEKIYKLSGTFGGAATSITWKTTGTGSFDNPLLPTATYRSSLADVLAGTVKLIICTNDPDGNGPCLAKADTMVLTMNGVKFKPLITVSGNLNSCGTDSVTLTATAGYYNYLWFKVGGDVAPFATTRSVVIKSSGGYYFKLVDPNKCCSIQSDTATVNYLSLPNAPITNNVKIDRGTTIDLNKLVTSNLPTGLTLVFKTGLSSGSTNIANPSAVGAGIYYAFYKNARGCFSAGTKIAVDNNDGVITSPANADIQITVTTENNIALDSTVKITITVRNNGPSTAKNVIVTSKIPAGLIYLSQTGGLVHTDIFLNGKLDSLVSGGIKVYTWIGKMNGSTTSVTVGATGTSNNPDPNPNNNNDSNPNGNVVVSVPPANSADIVVTITTDKTNYIVRDTVTTTIKVTNLGPVTAKNVTVSSSVPDKLTYVSQTGGLVINGKVLTGKLDSLVKNGVKVYTFKSVLTGTGPVLITGTGTSNNPDPNPNNNNGTSATGSVTINPTLPATDGADVAVVITSDKATAKVGDNVSFLISLTNNGPATAKQIVLTNLIPVGMTFLSSSTGQVLTGGAIVINLDSLQKGQVKTYTYVARMNVKTNVTNTVNVTSSKDNIPSNNTSFVIINGDTSTVAKDEADLAILLTADKQLIAKDDMVTFTIKVTNNGPKVATNVVIDDILPKYLTFQSGDPSQKGDTLRVITASIPVGNTITYTYKAKVNKDTIIRNTAKITKTSPIDPILTNNVSTVVLVSAADTTLSDLAVVIAANATTYKVGDNVTYTVTLTNNGGGFAKNVQLCNPLPNGLTYVSGTGIIKAGDSITIKIDTISKGKTRTFTYLTKATKAGTIANTVRICNSSKADLITPNNTSTSSIIVTDSVITTCKINLAMAILDTAKVSDGVYNVTYRLIAKNVCKDTLKNVIFMNNLNNVFKAPVTFEIIGKPNTGITTNLTVNDLFSKTDSNLVKVGSYMLPNAIDTIKYVVKITLNGHKGAFTNEAAIHGKTSGNENLVSKAKEVLRFDLPNTRIGLAKELLLTTLHNDSTTYWTVPYRIKVVNMGLNAITKLSVKDSLDAVFTAKGAKIIGMPIVIATPGLTVNKKFTGSGLFTDLLEPDSSSLAKGDTAIIDLIVRVNTATSTDPEKIYNNVAIGTATGTDLLTYKDISTNGKNPDANEDKDPSNDNVATPVKLSGVKEVSIGLALASVSDTIVLADSTCNATLIMTAKNYGTSNLAKVRLSNSLGNTIGKQSESWKLVGTPVILKGNAKINKNFNGTTDSTITNSDSTFLAVGDSIVVIYLINIRKPVNSTIYTHAIAKAVSALDSTKSTFDVSTNGLNPDVNKNGNPDEAESTPINCKGVPVAVADSTFFIPKGFSPNGDGVNDRFVISGIKSDEKVELTIFNRWGGVVYANQDYKNDWRGETNAGARVLGDGQGLPDGTYYYSITRLKITGEKVDAAPFVRYLTILR